jgi:hypothetical protein
MDLRLGKSYHGSYGTILAREWNDSDGLIKLTPSFIIMITVKSVVWC